MKQRRWEKLGRELVYKDKFMHLWLDQVRQPGGKTSTYSVVEFPDAVFVIAVDQDKAIYLIEQHRYPVDEVILELPAGGVEAGEDPCVRAG